MSAFCYEHLPFNPGKIKRRPTLAMDAALPEPDYAGNLIEALLKFATTLDADKKALLENLIASNADPRAAVAKDAPAIDPANVERACRFLAANGVDEGTINEVRRACGVSTNPIKRAQDAAIRETDRLSRATAAYERRFPEATRIRIS